MWTRRAVDHPSVARLLDGELGSHPASWAEQLEDAAANAIDGKVLSACAGLAIARRVHASRSQPRHAEEALTLLEEWIDAPTDARFERITDLLFVSETELDEVTWWALRVASASAGNHEAAWALSALCESAATLGLAPEEARVHGLGAVRARLK